MSDTKLELEAKLANCEFANICVICVCTLVFTPEFTPELTLELTPEFTPELTLEDVFELVTCEFTPDATFDCLAMFVTAFTNCAFPSKLKTGSCSTN